MMDSSKRQDGIGGSRLFYIVRTAKFGYGSRGNDVRGGVLPETLAHLIFSNYISFVNRDSYKV
jgi:hypothetical protein